MGKTGLNRLVLVLTLLPLLLSSTCSKVEKSDERLPFSWDDQERAYLLFEPASADEQSPLVIALHSSDLSVGAFRDYMGMDAVAEEMGFKVIYPIALEATWNFEGTPDFGGKFATADDLGFIAALIRHAAEKHGIDPSRVYVTGFGRGGQMALGMAWMHPDKVTAIAPISASVHAKLRGDFIYDGSVPTFAIHGDNDPVVPFDGGPGGLGGKVDETIGRGFMGVRDVMDRVADENGCHLQTNLVEPEEEPAPGACFPVMLEYTTCRAETTLVIIRGGGHTIPGREQVFDMDEVGRTLMEFDAPREIWAFFQRQPVKSKN